jgi:putative peptidoglycan lipid II flippase
MSTMTAMADIKINKGLSKQGLFTDTIINFSSRGFDRLLRLALLLIITKEFGAGGETDAYFVIQPLIFLFLLFADNALCYTLIPVLADYRRNQGENEAWYVANSVFTLTSICLAIIAVLVFFLAPFIVRILAPGFSEEVSSLTTSLLKLASPIALFVGLSAVPISIFYSFRSFGIPAVTSLFYAIGAILFALLLADAIGISSILLGAVIGTALQTGIILYYLKKRESKLRFIFLLLSSDPVTCPALVMPIESSSFPPCY